MGTSYQFICSKCDYEAVVSGGDDVGMACRTTTISCLDCGELFDAVISDQPWEKAAGPSDEELVCPGPESDETGDSVDDEVRDSSNPDHQVRRWTFPGSCPKCGQGMTKGSGVVYWD